MNEDLKNARWFKGGRKGRGYRNNSLPPALKKKLIEQGKLPELSTPSESPKSPKDFADILYASTPSVSLNLPESVTFSWEGARLITLNQQLRAGAFVMLFPYKKASHQICSDAILSTKELHGFQFKSRVEILVHRNAKRLVDNDALSAMFKYIIDGFRNEGLIKDDDPMNVVNVIPSQSKGDYRIDICFRVFKD